MRVLITGGAGFIGSRLLGRLLSAGDSVHVVDDLSLGTREHLAPHRDHPRFAFTEADLATPAFRDAMLSFRPDRVYHLAANSDISLGTRDPRTDLERTFLTTYHCLDAMRAAGVRQLVFASTSAIYGEADGALREDHGPLEPISLYGAAKLSAEGYVHAFANLYGLTAWVFRFPNVVGPMLTHGALYDFVRRLLRDETRLEVLGDGTQTKPYLHVDDLLDAIALGVSAPALPVATYNVAGDGATSVKSIAETVRALCGLPSAEITYGTTDRGWPGDVPRFAYDTAKIRALGWSPKLSSDEAVRSSVASEVERCKR